MRETRPPSGREEEKESARTQGLKALATIVRPSGEEGMRIVATTVRPSGEEGTRVVATIVLPPGEGETRSGNDHAFFG